jgi:MYXO-CTERM domain-containing protein
VNRTFLALTVLAASAASAGPKVLICYADNDNGAAAASLRTALNGYNVFDAVDVVNCGTSTPTLATLQGYNAVLVWDLPAFADRTTLGNNLADFVDSGGGVVEMLWTLFNGSDLSGRWSSAGYGCLGTGTYASSAVSLKPAPNDPTSPLVTGVSSLALPANQHDLSSPNPTRGATSVWDWSDGQPAVCQMLTLPGASLALNLYYGAATGDINPLVRNALLFASSPKALLTSTPTALAFPDTGVGGTSAPLTVTLKNRSSSAMTVTGLSLTGMNASDFNITNVPSTPITVPAQGTFDVALTFAPSAIGARTARLRAAVQGLGFSEDVSLAGNGLGPRVTVTPNPIRLSTTTVGNPVTATVTISNTGGTVTLNSASITLDTAEFSITSAPTFPVVLPFNAQTSLTVQFVATASGVRNGQLTLSTNDPSNPTLATPIVGTVGPPAITLDISTIIFAQTNVGATSIPQQVTLTNTGFSNLSVTSLMLSGVDPGDYVLNRMGFPAVLAPSANGKFSISFAPTATGSRTASINVASNDPANPNKVVALSGTATQAVLSLSPSSLAFGNVRVGAASATQTVTVSNTGTGTLQVWSGAINDADAGAYGFSGPPLPVGLNGAATAVAVLTCHPPTVGSFPATFDVTTDIGTRSVALSCTGIAPQISVMPASLDLGAVAVGTTSGGQNIAVTNLGTADLQLLSFAISGTNRNDFSQSVTDGGLTLAPAATTMLTVQFTPSDAGAESADLVINSDDLQSPSLHVSLSGTGATYGLSATPSALDFGDVSVGSTGMRTVALSSTGTGTVVVQGLQLSGSSAARFSTQQTTPFSVPAGQMAQVPIVYAPTGPGGDDAMITFTAAGVGAVNVTLHGNGLAGVLDAGSGEDGGSGTDGGSTVDAGAVADAGAPDAGAPAADAGMGAGTGGCGCQSGAEGMFAAALLALVRRRRRRDPRDG